MSLRVCWCATGFFLSPLLFVISLGVVVNIHGLFAPNSCDMPAVYNVQWFVYSILCNFLIY